MLQQPNLTSQPLKKCREALHNFLLLQFHQPKSSVWKRKSKMTFYNNKTYYQKFIMISKRSLVKIPQLTSIISKINMIKEKIKLLITLEKWSTKLNHYQFRSNHLVKHCQKLKTKFSIHKLMNFFHSLIDSKEHSLLLHRHESKANSRHFKK